MTMRVSIDKTDPGFLTYASLVLDGYIVRVTLDGVELPVVVTADETTGEVIVPRVTPDGVQVVQDHMLVYERFRGEVKIKVERPNDDRVLH